MRTLVVGDLHVQPSNIEETKNLFAFIKDQFIQQDCTNLLLLGDIFHTHSVIRQEVAYLVRDFLKDLMYSVVLPQKGKIYITCGNHDGISPSVTEKNALDLILAEYAIIVSGVNTYVTEDGFVLAPFIYDNEKFVEVVNLAKRTAMIRHPDPILICHQTFDGAAYESGKACAGGVRSQDIDYSVIVSGHIHKRQIIKDKVLYLGTPRPVTAAEVNDEKFIFVMTRAPDQKVSFLPISTKEVVKNYYLFDITEGDGKNLEDSFAGFQFLKDDVRVRVQGSQNFFDQMAEKIRSINSKIKIIPVIKKDLSKKINIEANNLSVESALEKYVTEIADIDPTIREDVWKTIQATLA